MRGLPMAALALLAVQVGEAQVPTIPDPPAPGLPVPDLVEPPAASYPPADEVPLDMNTPRHLDRRLSPEDRQEDFRRQQTALAQMAREFYGSPSRERIQAQLNATLGYYGLPQAGILYEVTARSLAEDRASNVAAGTTMPLYRTELEILNCAYRQRYSATLDMESSGSLAPGEHPMRVYRLVLFWCSIQERL